MKIFRIGIVLISISLFFNACSENNLQFKEDNQNLKNKGLLNPLPLGGSGVFIFKDFTGDVTVNESSSSIDIKLPSNYAYFGMGEDGISKAIYNDVSIVCICSADPNHPEVNPGNGCDPWYNKREKHADCAPKNCPNCEEGSRGGGASPFVLDPNYASGMVDFNKGITFSFDFTNPIFAGVFTAMIEHPITQNELDDFQESYGISFLDEKRKSDDQILMIQIFGRVGAVVLSKNDFEVVKQHFDGGRLEKTIAWPPSEDGKMCSCLNGHGICEKYETSSIIRCENLCYNNSCEGFFQAFDPVGEGKVVTAVFHNYLN